MPQNTLLITCSAGYGHIIATENIKNRLLAEDPNTTVVTLDVSPYIYPAGSAINTFWDFNMRYATRMMNFLPRLMVFIHYETLYEKFLGGPLRKEVAKLIQDNSIQTIYDAQPLFTNLMLNTLADADTQKQFTYNKVLSDLPTPRTQHFLPGIKRIKHRKNVVFKLHAQPAENTFWEKHCSLTPEQLATEFALPVNPEYLTMPTTNNKVAVTIPDTLANHYPLNYQNGELILPENAVVTTLMLGSQGLSVIPDYVDAYIAQAKAHNTQTPHFFFVACSRNEKLYQSLETKILESGLKEALPQHCIVPLPMQTPRTIAQLMWRSQQIVMRPSGLSCLEQLAMAQTRNTQDPAPTLWIHVPYKKALPKFENLEAQNMFLLAQSFGYERGNAEYLLAQLDARLASPKSIDLQASFV